jgi:elongation factor Ts
MKRSMTRSSDADGQQGKPISAEQVKKLREATGAGFVDCKRALEATNGDLEKAKDYLRQKGIAKAGAKASRIAGQGMIESYIHHNGQLGVIVEVNSESDFHIAAAEPKYLKREDVPREVLDRERAIFEAQARDQKKPDAVVAKIVEGKLNDFYKREVLLDQPFTKDDKKSIDQLVKEAIAKLGENITISRFARFKVGEAPTP